MKSTFLLYSILWLTPLCNGEEFVENMYQLMNKDENILNHFPFHEENTTNEIECFLKGSRQTVKTCFIQTEKINDGKHWKCSFFSPTNKTKLETTSRNNSKIYITSVSGE